MPPSHAAFKSQRPHYRAHFTGGHIFFCSLLSLGRAMENDAFCRDGQKFPYVSCTKLEKGNELANCSKPLFCDASSVVTFFLSFLGTHQHMRHASPGCLVTRPSNRAHESSHARWQDNVTKVCDLIEAVAGSFAPRRQNVSTDKRKSKPEFCPTCKSSS